jgi:hypothetical protein
VEAERREKEDEAQKAKGFLMRTYIAGKMRGVKLYNFPAFDAAAADLRSHGIEVVSPAELDRAAGFDPVNLPDDWDWSTLPEDFALRHAAERDLSAILKCDAIHLLPGWQESKGARAERAVAEWIGLGVFEL